MRNGFSFQAGAGGIALAFIPYLAQMMRERGVKAGFVRGGGTRVLVEMLKEGLTDWILDGQTFDLDAVRSIGTDPRHVVTSPFTSYNDHGKGAFHTMVDVAVLGATEVDVHFNANVVSHSDGRLLHGIGGWQNCLFAGCTILAVPSFRDRIPVIVDEVTTLVGPGELDRRHRHRARHRHESAPRGSPDGDPRQGRSPSARSPRSRPRSSGSAAASRGGPASPTGRSRSSSGWTEP